MPRISLVAAVALAAPAVSLGCEEFVEHPLPENLASAGMPAMVVSRARPAKGSPLADYARRFHDRQSVITVGVLSGAEEYVFGQVQDALAIGGDAFLVADRQAHVVRAYDYDGEHLYSIGAQGEGPGEFRFVEALEATGQGDVIVVDQAQMLHRFRFVDARLTYQDRSSIGAFAYGACRADVGLVVHALSAGQPEALLRVSEAGRVTGRFAIPYSYSGANATEAMARGQVTCAPEHGLVVLGFRLRGGMEAYRTADGGLAWHTAIEDHRPPTVVESDRGASITSGIFDADLVDYLDRVEGGSGAPIIAQYRRFRREDVLARTGDYVLRTYVFDPATGEGAYWGDTIPPILRAEGDYVFLLQREPFPRVELARLP